jgi:hypothetical protein
MSFPNFSNIQSFVQNTLSERKGNTELVSKLNPFVRITSGAGGGLVMVSNPDFKLLQAAGTTYGSANQAGAVGTTLGGAPVNPNSGQGYRPSPVVTSLEVDEGAGNLSRKASISITAFTKEQMETITKYYLEPGFSLFIEWGWGVGGYGGLQKLGASNVASFQSAVNTNKVRSNTGGKYDNYLGFITGGGVSLDGDKWTISINCTGYTELPTYLLTSETAEQKSGNAGVLTSAITFGLNYIDTLNSTPADERFMKMFNDLPQTRQTRPVKNLRNNANVNTLSSFVNFDDEVSEDINDESDGWTIPFTDWQVAKSSLTVDGVDVVFPKGTKIIGEERFIRFDTLMRIIYEIGIEGYELPDGSIITTQVDYEDTMCSAFENIFSTDASKLFIPNPNTPKIKLSAAPPGVGTVISDVASGVCNNSINGIQFPSQTDASFKPKIGNTITKPAQQFGYLKNLYVNFEFAKGVLETKNFYLKDALYQILNGMSSAVNGMWDFQIEETEVGNTSILKIWEMNMISNNSRGAIYTFDMVGENSVFIEASLDLDISGAKMNQIIGQKLGQTLNGDSSRIPKTLWQTNLVDSYGLKIKEKQVDNTDPTTQTDTDKKSIAEENLNIMLGKAKYYPKVDLTDKSTLSGELYDMCYLGAFADSNIFSAFKNGHDQIDEKNTASPLMPINFTFKVHGVSGIRRGDMFKVRGLPTIYDNGFFQVLSVKHSLQGMEWTTEVTGGYRNNS